MEGAGSFGGEIARLRKKRQQTIRELASKVILKEGRPMSASYLCDIEQGRKNPPGLDVIRRMAELLDGDLDRLLRLAQRTPPDIQEIVQENENVRRMLRKAKQLGFRDWKRVEHYIESHSKGPPKARWK
jgi:transcriptional regulator with XRE-family HTH domain